MGEMARIWENFEPPSGVRAEFIGGEIVMQANPTTLHNLIIRNIVRQVDGRSLEAWGEQGIELHEDSKPRPDVMIVRSEDIPIESRDWPHQIVQAVVEVVPPGRDAWKDDWHKKRDAYQEARIHRYLIIDPRDSSWHLLIMDFSASPPRYEEAGNGVFGQPVPMGVADEAGELVLETLTWHAYPTKDSS